MKSSLLRWRHYCDTDGISEKHEKIKYCAISFNMLRAGGLFRIFGFTAPLKY